MSERIDVDLPAPALDEQQERDHFNGVDVVHRHDERSELDVRAIAMRDGCESSVGWTVWALLARVVGGAGDDELERRVWDRCPAALLAA
jgi:hypothetical protein